MLLIYAYRELGQHCLLLKVIGLVGVVIIHGGRNGLGIAEAPPCIVCLCIALTGPLAGIPTQLPRPAQPPKRCQEGVGVFCFFGLAYADLTLPSVSLVITLV